MSFSAYCENNVTAEVYLDGSIIKDADEVNIIIYVKNVVVVPLGGDSAGKHLGISGEIVFNKEQKSYDKKLKDKERFDLVYRTIRDGDTQQITLTQCLINNKNKRPKSVSYRFTAKNIH